MWPGKRNQSPEVVTPESAPAVEVCAPEEGCYEAPNQDFVEQFDERTSEYVAMLMSESQRWGDLLAMMPYLVDRVQREESSDEIWREDGDSREYRRFVERQKGDHVYNTLGILHNASRAYVRRDLEDREKIGLSNDPVELADRLAVLDQTEKNSQAPDQFTKALEMMFISEQKAHAIMAILDLSDPQAFRSIFDHESLDDLPIGLQKLVSLDVNRDRESIVLRNARRELDDTRTQGQRMADYLRHNHLPEHIRVIALALSVGAKAMGAPSCPLNEAGLCTKVLDRMPYEDLPEQLRRDMEQKAAKETNDRGLKLRAFARRMNVPRLFDSAVAYDTSVTGDRSVQGKKRRQSSIVANRQDLTLTGAIEAQEQLSFNDVVAQILNDDESVTFNRLDDTSPDAGIQALLDSKMFSEFTSLHRSGEAGTEMLKKALNDILFSTNYTMTDGAIVPWLDMRRRAFENTAGVREKFFRFSANSAKGSGGGVMGRQTRIIFSQGTKDGVRYVTIHKVALKADLAKSAPRLRTR